MTEQATKPLCARCYTAPEGPRNFFDHLRKTEAGTIEWFCSEEHMHLKEEPATELARLAVALCNADLMFHFFLSIGRDDDLAPDSIIQRRRVMIADRIQELSKLPEIKEILL